MLISASFLKATGIKYLGRVALIVHLLVGFIWLADEAIQILSDQLDSAGGQIVQQPVAHASSSAELSIGTPGNHQ